MSVSEGWWDLSAPLEEVEYGIDVPALRRVEEAFAVHHATAQRKRKDLNI